MYWIHDPAPPTFRRPAMESADTPAPAILKESPGAPSTQPKHKKSRRRRRRKAACATNENAAFRSATRPSSAANDLPEMMSTPVYQHPSFHSSRVSQPPIPATNENAGSSSRLDHPEFSGLYKPAQTDPSQDLTATHSRVNSSGSGLSSPSLQQPCTKPFSGLPSRHCMTSPHREAGDAVRERPGIIYPLLPRAARPDTRVAIDATLPEAAAFSRQSRPPTALDIAGTSLPESQPPTRTRATKRQSRKRRRHRSSGVYRCDVSRTFEDLPDPLASSSKMVHRPAVQVNRFSWFNNAKTDKHLDEKRREFRNSRKYPNSASLFPPQQASLVSQERLQAVVRKVDRGNRFKGKKQQTFVVKEQHTNEHKVMTSLAHSRQKAEGGNQRDFYYKYHKESGTDGFASTYQYKTSMHLVKPSGNQEEQETKQSHFHQSDVMDDAVKVERGELNKLIARKDHTAPKHSCSYVKEDDYSSVNMSKQFFVQLACMLMVIGNVIKSVTSLNSLNLKRVIGLATLACVSWEYCVIAVSLPTVLPYGFGGKRSYAYSSLNSIIYASWIRYFGKYIYNLDFEYETSGSFKLVYSYIQAFDSSRMIWNQATLSSEFATLPCNKLYTLVYLLSEWNCSVIIIHDKYHRQFLFGLTLVCNAILRNQCFLLRSCTNWEELRPLVTSRAYGIKEGFNPCVIQKQFMPWYALVSLSLLSLLSLTILLCYFYCFLLLLLLFYCN